MYQYHKIFLTLGLLTLVGCNSNDYLYYSNPVAKSHNDLYPITSLDGNAQIDILWTIDNSGSMAIHQQDVLKNTNLFIQQFTKGTSIDWKMGLISTDDSERPYVGLLGPALDHTMADASTIFQNAVGRLGTNGSGTEKMFIPVQEALTNYPTWVRPSAILALIIVTDAPEQSDLQTAPFLDFLKTVKGSLNKVVTYGVVGPQDFNCPQTDDFWNYAGSKYEDLINSTHGKVYKLCDPNFGQNLIDLGSDLFSRATHPKIYLKDRPRIASLQVLFHGKQIPGGTPDKGGFWIYDFELNAVVFSDLSFAGDNESVSVAYDIDDGK